MNDNAAAIRHKISEWLSERLNAKLEKLETDNPKYQSLVEQFQYDNWIADAARRVGQLQVVTHSLKPIHPDAKGSSIYAPPANDAMGALIGTPMLGSQFAVDVVGNAAALDVFKFLKQEHEGKTLLEHVEQRSPDLAIALSDNPDTGQQLVDQFAKITEPRGRYASHTRAKQLYWLVGDEPAADEDFHLLAPLYATSLAQRVFQTVKEDLLSDGTRAARQARRNQKAYEYGYCEYPQLAIQRFGGDNGKQNISQLNSERNGQSYLFGSAPPIWNLKAARPIQSSTAFQAYGYRTAVYACLNRLGDFLATDPRRNMHTRDYRDQLTCELVDELIVFTSEMHQLPAGWTADWHCRLPFEQQCWLDPHRAHQDPEFAERLIATDWLPTVCTDFSRWLTGRLERHWRISMGDPEHRHFSREAARDNTVKAVFETEYANWRAKLETELAGLKEVLDDDDE